MATTMHYFLFTLTLQFLVEAALAASSINPILPFGDINVVVVTDVHSWVGGHKDRQGDRYNADYGDVISFVEHLKAYAAESDQDIWFVMNGDWIDGTGLAMNGDTSKLEPILLKMPWDAMNVGNHELYRDSVVQSATRIGGMIESFGKRYLSSNVLHSATQEPIGHRFRILRGKNSNVLTFGFLYNMQGQGNSELVQIRNVEAAVQEDWFVSAIKDTKSYDAILVLAHMGVRDPLCTVVLEEIRNMVGELIPVQFLTGHTHIRDFQRFDNHSASFEGGKYLETVGFVSFPSKQSIQAIVDSNQGAKDIASDLNATKLPRLEVSSPFKYQYLDANKNVFADALGISSELLPTENGVEQSQFIMRIENELGLKKVVGCMKDSLFSNRSMADRDSLWGFFARQVTPSVFRADEVIILDNGSWRYDLYGGEVSLNDILGVSPYNNSLVKWDNLPSEVITALNATLNAEPDTWMPFLPSWILSSAEPFVPRGRHYSLIVDDFQSRYIAERLNQLWSNNKTDPLSPPKDMPGVTSSSIWIEYFENFSSSCSGHHNGFHSSGGGNGSSPSGFARSNPKADAARLGFAVFAVLVVGILGSVLVWQRATRFNYLTTERDYATREALQEYEGDEELYLDESDEGGFVGEYA